MTDPASAPGVSPPETLLSHELLQRAKDGDRAALERIQRSDRSASPTLAALPAAPPATGAADGARESLKPEVRDNLVKPSHWE
jgi:hypothetical protein